MKFTEHWRLRLLELLSSTGMTQAAFAEKAEITPDYLSRLLYPPDKAGRKNLGAVTARKISIAYALPPGWFDQPLGSGLGGVLYPRSIQPVGTLSPDSSIVASEPIGREYAAPKTAVDWPFEIVTYQRIARLRQHFSGRGKPMAISEIDKHLDVLVTRWENEMNKQKSSAA